MKDADVNGMTTNGEIASGEVDNPDAPPVPAGRRRRLAKAVEWVLAHPVLAVVVVAFFARLGFALATFALNPYLQPDETQYIGLATWVADGRGAEAWYPGYGEALYRSTWVFSAPLAFLFDVFGPSRIHGQLYAALFGVLAAALTVMLASRLVDRRHAVAAGLIVALLPSQVVWSSIVLRESLIWAGLVTMALIVSRAADADRRRLAGYAVSLVVLLFWLGHLRSQTMVVAAWALLLAAWLIPGRERLLRGVGASALAVLLPLVLGVGPLGWEMISSSAPSLARTRASLGLNARSATSPTSMLSAPASGMVCPESGRSAGQRPGTPTTLPGAMAIAGSPRATVDVDGQRLDLICTQDGGAIAVEGGLGADLRYLPKGFAAMLLRPFPWEQGGNASARGAALENPLWYALYVLAAIGLLASHRRLDVVVFPVLVSLGILGTGTLTQGNLGTAFRQRAQILWAITLLAVAGVGWLQGELARRRASGT